MVNPKYLKKTSTVLMTCFFLQSAFNYLWQLHDHSWLVSVAMNANQSFVKLVMVVVSLGKLVATAALTFPIFAELRNGHRLACACLAAASFLELLMNACSSDKNTWTTSAFLSATCLFRLLETFSARDMRISHGSIGQPRSYFDNFLCGVRQLAVRYKAGSTATVLIFGVFTYTAATTECMLWRTTSLKRELAMHTWSKTASVILLLATIGASDISKTRGQKKSL